MAADSPEAKKALERVEEGDTSVTVTPVGGETATVQANEAEDTGEVVAAGEAAAKATEATAALDAAATPVVPATPASGPTAAAPGSKRK